jgi:hypothetical protein
MGTDLATPGMGSQAPSSTWDRPRPATKRLRLCGVIAWGSWLVSIGPLWEQHKLRTLHPWSLPFLLLLAVTVLGFLCGLTCAVWCVVRGPSRAGALVS